MMSSPSSAERLSRISKHLLIQVIHDAKDFVVIEKPCNLRSVPGHAKNSNNNNNNYSPTSKNNKRKKPESGSDGHQRRTAQEAWVLAIQSFQDTTDTTDIATRSLRRLASAESKLIQSVPRKLNKFRQYLERNQKRLLDGSVSSKEKDLDDLANVLFQRIQERQRPLMNLPEPTKDEESAMGQLLLMGYGSEKNACGQASVSTRLWVVHRLDCETSGLMVFAKNETTASFLSKAWRERDRVRKHYLALVRWWPPYHEEQLQAGTVDVPLEASEERLKWKVSDTGKPSTTKWQLLPSKSIDNVMLELQPITGRTHQLRIHCAHIGSGIVGDSLYGTDRVKYDPLSGVNLHLHARKLSFPHPNKQDTTCDYSCSPPWYDISS